jgi:hypothetical protein
LTGSSSPCSLDLVQVQTVRQVDGDEIAGIEPHPLPAGRVSDATTRCCKVVSSGIAAPADLGSR